MVRADKKQILIISDRITDTSTALERALRVMFAGVYNIGYSASGTILSDLAISLPMDQQKRFLSFFEDICSDLQSQCAKHIEENKKLLTDQECNKYDAIVREIDKQIQEKQAVIDGIKAKRDGYIGQIGWKEGRKAHLHFNAQIIPLETEITKLKAGKSILDAEIFQKIDELENKAQNQTIIKKAALVDAFLAEQKRVDTSFFDISAELPPVLLEDCWIEAQESRNLRIEKLLRDFGAKAHGSLQYEPFNDQRRKALKDFLQNNVLILIIAVDPTSSHAAITFLRKFWAHLIKHDIAPLPTIFISLHSIEELIRQDKRYSALLAEDCEVLPVPFLMTSLRNVIKYRIAKSPLIASTTLYLKQSADLAAEGIMEHRWKNLAAPYSLMMGAYYAGELSKEERCELLKKFYDSEAGQDDRAWDEVMIYSALASNSDTSPVKRSSGGEPPEKTLREIMRNKKILLIDDKADAYGLAETVGTLCTPQELKVIRGNWKDYNALCSDTHLRLLLESEGLDELEKYDLILLDLYLTGEDEDRKKEYPNIKPPEGVTFGGLRLLKAFNDKPGFTVPVILFTASTRHFNIEAAESVGIEGYFEKKGCYADHAGSLKYYLDFKELLRKAICYERTLLRYAWKGIQRYRNQNINSVITNQLEAVYYSIETYLRDRNNSLLVGSSVIIGSFIEHAFKGRGNVFNPYTLQQSLSTSRFVNENEIYAFIAHQIRGTGAHPEKSTITLEDVFFAFFALLRAFQIVDKIVSWDQCASWSFGSGNAAQMSESLRISICPTISTAFECASFLSWEDNLKSRALQSQMLFRYLFFIQCLETGGFSLPDVFLHLFKLRISRCIDFHVPFKMDRNGDFYWVGRKRIDASIISALGVLGYTMYQNEKSDGEFVLFHPTPKYLRG